MEMPMEPKQKQSDHEKAKPHIWDCGSSLYDSFELKSFERQLDSAMASRTLSMPHLSDGRLLKRPPEPQPSLSKKPSKLISRSIHKFLRSLFKPKQSNNSLFQRQDDQFQDGFYVVYDRSSSGALTTIPEGPEFDALSPEIRSLVTRTTSERFTANSIGISCA